MEWFEAIFEIFGSAFLKKIEVKGGHDFLNINFLLDSILILCVTVNFRLKVA